MDKITITREQFQDAVTKSQDEFLDMTCEPNDGVKGMMTVFLMGLQNAAFASAIEKNLFGEEPIKEDTTIDN